MRKLFHLHMMLAFLALSACVSHAIFPVSSILPAADISITQGAKRQHNPFVEIVVMHLASTEQLAPPGTNYSVCILTKAHGHVNTGQSDVKNTEITPFKRIVAFDFYFITVTQQGDLDNQCKTEHCRIQI